MDKKTKSHFLIFFAGLFFAFLFALYFSEKEFSKNYFGNEQIKKIAILRDGLKLYNSEKITSLKVDEFLFLKLISDKTGYKKNDLFFQEKKFETSPFIRLLSRDNIYKNLKIEKQDINSGIGKPLNTDLYKINTNEKNLGPWDDILVKALYCDKTGYDNSDFFILNFLNLKDNGYYDTHYLFGLILLRENGCFNKTIIDREIDIVSKRIVDAEQNETTFSDLFAERIVMLYWAGYGNFVKEEWIKRVVENFDQNYGWKNGSNSFNGHTTGLSILSIIYNLESKNLQNIF